jgi:hypothetical protein
MQNASTMQTITSSRSKSAGGSRFKAMTSDLELLQPHR